MTRPGVPTADAGGTASGRPHPLPALLLWSGALAFLLGFVTTRTWESWAPGRLLELLVLAIISMLLALPLRRWKRWPWAIALALPWVLALPIFGGLLPTLATVVFALSAIAVGGLLAPKSPMALRCTIGLILIAGVLGWLLPLPIHHRWTYGLAAVALLTWQWRQVLGGVKTASRAMSIAINESPKFSAWAIMALGLASTGCWLPTLQFDDLAYHLSLPWQLMESGRYTLDPSQQIWALAPWASDVQQAVVQVLAGREARGPLNAVWISVTAAGLWSLTRSMEGSVRAAWLVVALYASLPLTSSLGAGMQTETATTALLAWLSWLVVTKSEFPLRYRLPGRLLIGSVLVGGLLGLKLMAAASAGILVLWAALEHRPWPRLPALIASASIALALGLSSYAYAAFVAGNPFLPLFNSWFQSPYYPAADFADPRWHAGFSLLLPWSLTFSTPHYSEGFAGAAGFGLIMLGGAWLLSLCWKQTRPLALVASALFLLPLLPLQYLRYAFPAMALLVVPMTLAALRADPRRAAWILAALAILNFAFQANGNWMQRTGGLKQVVLGAGNDLPLFEHYTIERTIIAAIRTDPDGRRVMLMNADQPRHAELGTRGLTTSGYAPAMREASRFADADPTGAAWLALWEKENVGHVVIDPTSNSPAREAALQRAGAVLKQQVGDVRWLTLPSRPAP